MIDFHCHTFLIKSFSFIQIIERIKKEGIKIIDNGLNFETNQILLKNFGKENYYIALGFHPTYVAECNKECIEKTLKQIEENIDKIVAIGEVGLDYYWIKDQKLREKQKEIFKKIIEISKEYDKILIIHSRQAEKDVVELIDDYNILHSYTGKIKYIKNRELFFSIPPAIKRIPNFKNLVEKIDIEYILLETDSPYMNYEKGKENYPWNIKITIKEIAKIKNMDEKEVINQIEKNEKKILKIF